MQLSSRLSPVLFLCLKPFRHNSGLEVFAFLLFLLKLVFGSGFRRNIEIDAVFEIVRRSGLRFPYSERRLLFAIHHAGRGVVLGVRD